MNATNSNSSTSSVSSALLTAPYQLNIALGIFIFITGNISCIGNLSVFSSRTFRHRACSIYLVAESVSTFFYFNYVLVTRIIQKGFRLPIINRYDVVCKVRQFLSEYTHQVAFTLFILAAVDRLLSVQRSVAYRRWSNRVSLAYIMVPIVVLFWLSLTGHRLFLYSTSSGTCLPQPGFYEKFDTYFEVMMSGVWPPTILFVLGGLLMRSIRKMTHRRIHPEGIVPQATTGNLTLIQQIDSQLTTMLLLQSFVAIPSFIPFGAQNLYSNITQDWYKSPLRLAWENVIIETIRLFSYLFYSTSFYVSFYSSRGFRKQVLHSIGIKRYEKPANQGNTVLQNMTAYTIENKERKQS